MEKKLKKNALSEQLLFKIQSEIVSYLHEICERITNVYNIGNYKKTTPHRFQVIHVLHTVYNNYKYA